jgi:hypothetical protein
MLIKQGKQINLLAASKDFLETIYLILNYVLIYLPFDYDDKMNANGLIS